MKKFLSLFIALLMVCSMAVFANAEEPTEIEFWYCWGSGGNYDVINELIDEFNAANEGKYHVTGQYTGGYADTLSKFIVAYSSGTNPTVSIIDACMTMNTVAQDVVANLSEYARKNDPEYDFDQFIKGLLLFSTDINGDIWSLPYGRSTQIMYVNLDLVEQAIGEKKVPETWDDLWALSEAWTGKTGTPTFSHVGQGGILCHYVGTLHGEWMSKDGNGACLYVNDAWEKALTMWREMIDKGYYEVPSLSTSSFWEEFMAGTLPVALYSTGALTQVMNNATFDWAISYLPGNLEEDGSIFRCVQTGGANLMMAANKTDAEKEAGWELIKHMTSLESNIKMSFATGYILSHNGVEEIEEVKAKWDAEPKFRVAYDQLQFVREMYVSEYTSEANLEGNDILSSFVMDGWSVKETLDAYDTCYSSIFPNGIVDSYE